MGRMGKSIMVLLLVFAWSGGFAAAARAEVTIADIANPTDLECDRISGGEAIARPPAMDDAGYDTLKASIAKVCLEKQSQQSFWPTWFDWSKFVDAIKTLDGAVGAVASLAVVLMGVYIWLKQKAMNVLRFRNTDPIYPNLDEYEHEAINMVVVGEGGSGKTTLIHALCGDNGGYPTHATASFATYSIIRDIGIKTNKGLARRITRIYVDDYVGQDFKSIVDNAELRKRKVHFKKTTLVILVDVNSAAVTTSFGAEIDRERIKDQIGFYGDGVIQILGGMADVGDNIVLFINKLDTLKIINAAEIAKIKRAYQPLVENLKKLRGRNLHVIAGSASLGWGIVGDDGGNVSKASLYEYVVRSGASVSEAMLEAARRDSAIHGNTQPV